MTCAPCAADRHADCEAPAGDCTNLCHPPVPLDARTRAIRRRAGLTGPQPTWHCNACDAVVWLWYGRTYATREGALEARPQPPHARPR